MTEMTDTSYIYEATGGVPIKAWTKGVEIEDEARQQLHNVALLPFIHKHVAVMPDCHWGMGATIGSVIPTKGAIIPAAVGVDIGCGMMAVQTSLTIVVGGYGVLWLLPERIWGKFARFSRGTK